MGRDPVSKLKSRLKFRFQSTRPHGARLRSKQIRCISSCFNPRARMGRDTSTGAGLQHSTVSIHAPAWGATFDPRHLHSHRAGFNPRARMGRDPVTSSITKSSSVSIHAPAWGATAVKVCPKNSELSFNPRARMGRDMCRQALGSQRRCFNPRARMGRDPSLVMLRADFPVSIHAPAWGATTVKP